MQSSELPAAVRAGCLWPETPHPPELPPDRIGLQSLDGRGEFFQKGNVMAIFNSPPYAGTLTGNNTSAAQLSGYANVFNNQSISNADYIAAEMRSMRQKLDMIDNEKRSRMLMDMLEKEDQVLGGAAIRLNLLSMRMRWGQYNSEHPIPPAAMNLRDSLGISPKIQNLYTLATTETVFVIMIVNDKAVILEDSVALYPSDSLVAQIRLLT